MKGVSGDANREMRYLKINTLILRWNNNTILYVVEVGKILVSPTLDTNLFWSLRFFMFSRLVKIELFSPLSHDRPVLFIPSLLFKHN